MKKRILFVLMTVLFLSVSNFLQGAITVTTPNGGETWFPGSAYDITWFSSETVGNFKIEFSPDNGSNWTEITAATENDGIYNWTVPALSSATCLVRVSEIDGDPSDTSDAVFTISGGSISGRVTDESGNGLENIHIDILGPDYLNISSTLTDAAGYYIAQGIPSGSWKVYFSDYNNPLFYQAEYYNNKQSLESAEAINVIVGQTIANIDAQLTSGGVISGRVTNESGNGIYNVYVHAFSTNWGVYVSTNMDGYYQINAIPPGSYNILFDTQQAGNYIREWYNNKNSSDDADIITVTAHNITANINAQLAGGGTIRGTVTDQLSQGIQGINVEIYDLNNLNIGSASTDTQGNYSIEGIPGGSYKIYFNANRQNFFSEWYNDKTSFDAADAVAVTTGQITGDIGAQLAQGGIISGQVIDGVGNSIANVSVQAYNFDSGDYVTSSNTDANGNYSICGLSSGNYIVYFYPPNNSDYIYQWYNNQDSSETANPVNVIAGQTTNGINAQLVLGSSISGRVTDESNAGIFNLSVIIYFNNTNIWEATDANGYYTVHGIPAGNCKVMFYSAYSGNYIQEWYNNKNSEETADILSVTPGQNIDNIDAQLETGSIISGRVTDISGNGIPDVQAMAQALSDNSTYTYMSDANGYYHIHGLKPGSYKIGFFTQNAGNYIREWYSDKSGFDNADIIEIGTKQTVDNIDAQLAEGGIIRGRITDKYGNGIESIEVYLYDLNYSSSLSTSTDSQGNYSLEGIPSDDYKIFFRGYHQNYIPEWYNDKTSFDTAEPVTVKVGQITSDIDAELAQGGMISGRVTDAGGNGIPNVSANVHNQDNEILYQHCHTDTLGNYTIYGIPGGTYKVDFTCYSINYLSEWYNDKNSFETADPVEVTVGQTIPDIDAQLTEGGTISGTVTGMAGIPLENIYVEARISNNVTKGSAYTNSVGQYSIQKLPAGTYKIHFSNNGQNYFPTWYNNKATYETADSLNIAAGQAISNIDAQLVAGGNISGTVTDSLGNPINLVNVTIYDLNNISFGNISTNSNGYYIIGNLPAGNYKISFTPPNGSVFISEWFNNKTSFADADAIPVSAGQTTPGIDAQLLTGGTVTGTVTDISGNPIQNINVGLYFTSNTSKTAITNAQGQYEISGISTGNYKIYFNGTSAGYCPEWYIDKSTYDTADSVAVSTGQNTAGIDAQLILGGVLSGRVTAENGNGIQNVRVRLYDSTGKQVANSNTNSSGNYTLLAILPGNYRVYFDTVNVTGNYVFEFYNNKFVLSGADFINIISGQTTTIDAVLSPGAIMSGRITDTGGNGIPGVQVGIRDASNSSKQYKYKYTDSNGNYTVQGIPGVPCKVYFNTSNTEDSYVPEWYNDKTDSYAAEIFTFSPGQSFSGINAILASGGTVSGRITNAATGIGIPEMEVYAYDLNGNLVDTYGYADENGDYTVKGLPTGNYKINFETYYYNLYYGTNYNDHWYNNKNTIQTADNVAVTVGQTTTNINAALTTGGGVISGRVTDETGAGIANTIVYVMKDWNDIDYWDNQTDADGYYHVSGITGGSYHVYFLSPITPVNYASQIYNGKIIKMGSTMEGDWVQVTDGSTTPNIDAVLSSAGTITGRVTDTNGNGLQNIKVRLYNVDGEYFAFLNAATDYYGNYTISRIPPGQWKAYFSSSDGLGGQYRNVFYNNKQTLSGADSFMVQVGLTTTGINAVMTAGGGGTICGTVRLKNGQAIIGASVNLYAIIGPYSLLSQVSTNSSGYFEFKGTLPGMYKLNASCKSIYSTEWYNEKATYTAANIVTVTEGGAAQVEIILGETDALQVTSPNGGEVWDGGSLHAITWTNEGPVGDVKIEYSIDNGLNWTEIVSATENTGNYNWTVPAVPSANCKIRISGPGGVLIDTSDAVFTIFASPAGWVPVIGMQNNMVVYGKAYHGITAAAAGDWIGAFGPGGSSDCRGIAVVDANGNYYITIRSDVSNGETITFKLWPNPSGPTVDGSETIEFLADNIYADLPLHFGPRIQNIPLMAGWNWISFNTLPADTSLNSIFASILGSVEQVKSQAQAAIYSSGNWIGDLTDMSGIAHGIMYKVKTNQISTLSVTGLTIPFNKSLALVMGWNWTAYLPLQALPVESALNSIITPLSQAKSQTQSAVKIGSGLIGDLAQMEPHKGYTIRTTAPGVLVYPYTAAVSLDRTEATLSETNPDVQDVHWKVIKGNQYNMVAFGKVYLEEQAIDMSGYYLVSEGPNGERDCRSVSSVGTDGYYFSTILGNTNGETIKFKLFDSINRKTYSIVETLGFQSDDLRADYNLTARSIKVTAPAGGEAPVMGSACNIAWDAFNVTNVKIELYKNGKSLSTIAASLPASTQTYNWIIPTRMHAGSNYQIKISAVDPGVSADDISNTFAIVPIAGLTLNYPIAAATWQVKRSYDITWGATGINNIKVELYKGAVLHTVITESTPAASGKFTWAVPANQTLGSDYKIKISSLDVGTNLSDISKSPFAIVAYKNTAADFDGDGGADIVWRYYGTGGYNCLWLSGVGQGSAAVDDPRQAPQAALIQDETGIDNKIVGTGDFNNDGQEDILWRNKTDGANFVWTMNGITFAGSVPLQAETVLSWDICGTGDFNSDGKPDILWRNRTDGSNKVWLMNGTTKTGEVLLTAELNQAWGIGGAGDFNGDGKPDILWRNTADGSNRIWIMNGTAFVRAESLSVVNSDWEVVGVGDYDGNGKPDIFWRNKVDCRNSVWLMDGLARQKAETLAQVTDATWKIEN